MAKYDEREGNSCHIHLSLRGTDGSIVFADDDRNGGHSEVFDQGFLAGVLATMREFSYFYAPNINSYKRFAAGSFAPTAIALGPRQPHVRLRVVGHGAGLRVENRRARRRRQSLPRGGGDARGWVCTASARDLDLEDEFVGNAYVERLRAHVPVDDGRGASTCVAESVRHGCARHVRRRGRRPLRRTCRGRGDGGLQLRRDGLGDAYRGFERL
jgi:glutamine synthetase